MSRELKSILAIAVAIGAAWWLLRRLPKSGTNLYETRTPEQAGLRTAPPHRVPMTIPPMEMQPLEESIDEMIEASFPASDPSAWTPVHGTGRISW